MAEAAKRTGKGAEKETEKEQNAVEQFMALEHSELVIPPNALGSSNRVRALALLANMTGGGSEDPDEIDYAAVLNGAADAVDWVARHAAKDKAAFEETMGGLPIDRIIEYTMAYLTAVGEL